MKIFTTSLFFFFVIASFGQNQLPNDSAVSFSLTLSTYNHGELIFNGSATYELTKDSIKVKKRFMGDNNSQVVYAASIPGDHDIISMINRMRLDSLKNGYVNFCVLPTSGSKYTLTLVNGLVKKQIHLYHYYLKQVEDITAIINSYLPESYQLRYLRKDTEQDCKL